MVRSQLSLGNARHLGRQLYPRMVTQHQPRTCMALAMRGRGLKCTLPTWAWLGGVAWRDSSADTGQDPAACTLAPPVSTRASAQSASAEQRVTNPDRGRAADLTGDERACTDADSNRTSNSVTGGKAGSASPWPLTQLSSPESLRLQQRVPPLQTQMQAQRADTVITFAYGANMNFLTLVRREVRVLSRDPAFVVDPRVRLVFKHQGGYATLERDEDGGGAAGAKVEPRFRPYDGRVHGVLYRVTQKDFEKLAKREGGYVVQEVQVQTYDGSQHSALAFVSNPLFKLPQEVLPTEQYLARVREGARDNYLDPGYQAFLSGISTVPGTGLGSEYYNTPSKYMGYSFLVVAALITVAFFFQH